MKNFRMSAPAFASMQDESNKFGETRDCSVKAVAIACEVDYGVAHAALKKHGRKDKRSAYHGTINNALKELGFKKVKVDCSARTVTTIPRDRAFRNGRFMVFVSGHVLAVTDGTVQDWTAGRQHRVKEAYEIVRMDAEATVVTPAPAPAPKAASVKVKCYRLMDLEWEKAGRPTDVKVVRKLRIAVMDKLEATYGVKRTTASVTLGHWQKERLV